MYCLVGKETVSYIRPTYMVGRGITIQIRSNEEKIEVKWRVTNIEMQKSWGKCGR